MRLKIVDVIERDYLNVIRKKMEGVYTAVAGQDRSERERREKDQKAAFIVSRFCPPDLFIDLILQIYLNDLDVSGDYIERLMEDISASLPQVFIETDIPMVEEELKALSSLSSRFRNASKVGHTSYLPVDYGVLAHRIRPDLIHSSISSQSPVSAHCWTTCIATSAISLTTTHSQKRKSWISFARDSFEHGRCSWTATR
jgi:hypothetical protein